MESLERGQGCLAGKLTQRSILQHWDNLSFRRTLQLKWKRVTAAVLHLPHLCYLPDVIFFEETWWWDSWEIISRGKELAAVWPSSNPLCSSPKKPSEETSTHNRKGICGVCIPQCKIAACIYVQLLYFYSTWHNQVHKSFTECPKTRLLD